MDLSFVYTTKSKFDNNEVALQHGQVIAVCDQSGGNDALYIDLLDETTGQVSRHSFSSGGTGYCPTAYCSTGASAAAKTATCTSYQLLDKSYTIVLISNNNSYAGALTLSINGKTAKPIYINGSASSSTNYTLPAGSYLVYYDGTNYYFRTDGKITALGLKNTSNGDIYTNNSGTVTKVSTGVGLTGGDITGTGTVKAKLRSETALTNDSAAATETSGRVYPVAQDKSGYLAVNVPWTDNNTWKANSSSSEGYVASGSGQANKVWKTDADGVPAWRDDSNTWKANSSSSEGYVASGSGQANKVWKTDADGVPAWRDDANTTYTAANAAPGKIASASAQGSSTNYARQDHTHGIDLATGDSNGQVKIAGTNVSVKGLGDSAYKNSGTYYGTCTTAADAQAKEATIASSQNFTLKIGAVVCIKFTNSNTFTATDSAVPTLNVNSTGAKTIYYAGSAANTGTNTTAYGRANYINQYIYDGTYWVWQGSSADNNTTYSAMSTSELTTGTATTSRVVRADYLKSGINSLIEAKGYTSNTGTVTKVSTGVGLTGGDVTTTGTIKAKLRSETALTNDSAAATETSGRVYPVAQDKSGYLAVNVPWTDNNTWTANSSTAAGYVASGSGQANKVWKTDANGNPAWRDDSNSNTIPSAYCSTNAGTAAKTASCTDYALLSKSYIMVIIKTANTSKSALTLNINSKGAKPIYINGSASSSSNYTLPAGSYLVYYNGTNYYFRTDGKITGDITGSAGYSNMNQSEANTGTATTGRLITAKVLDTKIRNVVNEFNLSVSLEDGHLYYGFS